MGPVQWSKKWLEMSFHILRLLLVVGLAEMVHVILAELLQIVEAFSETAAQIDPGRLVHPFSVFFIMFLNRITPIIAKLVQYHLQRMPSFGHDIPVVHMLVKQLWQTLSIDIDFALGYNFPLPVFDDPGDREFVKQGGLPEPFIEGQVQHLLLEARRYVQQKTDYWLVYSEADSFLVNIHQNYFNFKILT